MKPITTDEEVNAAIKILVAMYLFVTGSSITDLEMQEGVETSADELHPTSYKDIVAHDEGHHGYCMAAEPGPDEE